MTVACPPRSLTRAELAEALEQRRLVTADTAAQAGFPKATVNAWARRRWITPVHAGPPRWYLTDDLFDLRDRLKRQEPPRDTTSGRFVRRDKPR